MIKTKYLYYNIIQGKYSGQWEDLDHHEANSMGTTKHRQELKDNFKAYREAEPQTPFRIVFRREINAIKARQA